MSTNSLTNTPDFLPRTQSLTSVLFGKVRMVVDALAEAKAAADQYETLTARGVGPGEASQKVFRDHFGQR